MDPFQTFFVISFFSFFFFFFFFGLGCGGEHAERGAEAGKGDARAAGGRARERPEAAGSQEAEHARVDSHGARHRAGGGRVGRDNPSGDAGMDAGGCQRLGDVGIGRTCLLTESEKQ